MNQLLVGDGVVCMGDIESAIQEVFQAPHIQVSRLWHHILSGMFSSSNAFFSKTQENCASLY
jgi:hypothetical protein